MPARKRIVATDMDLPPELVSEIRKASPEFDVLKLDELRSDEGKKVEALILLRSGMVSRRLFGKLPNLKVLQSMSAGVDFIDHSSIPSSVTLCSNAGAYGGPIAEHVFGMILYFAKHLGRNHERLTNGRFEVSNDGTFLAGKTLGAVGAGGIGQSVARVAKAFNMRTLGINTSGRQVPGFDKVWKMDHLDDLLKSSDFVVVSLPLNAHTRNLIDSRKLNLMKEDATIVNVARGPIISQSDLYAHLKSHPMFKAGIDVWWSYPKKGERFAPDFPFFRLPNFLGSPHNADGVPEAVGEGQRHAVENILRYVRGEQVDRVIDKSLYEGFRVTRHP